MRVYNIINTLDIECGVGKSEESEDVDGQKYIIMHSSAVNTTYVIESVWLDRNDNKKKKTTSKMQRYLNLHYTSTCIIYFNI